MASYPEAFFYQYPMYYQPYSWPIMQPVGTHPVGTHPVGTHPVGTHPVGTHPVGTHPMGVQPFDVSQVSPKIYLEIQKQMLEVSLVYYEACIKSTKDIIREIEKEIKKEEETKGEE
jgi:hypothetical protein